MTQTIRVGAGEIEYTWPVTLTELSGADITGDTVQICLGSYDAPGTFVTPDRIEHPTDSSVAVSLLIGDSYRPAPGAYWVWVKITDSPEVPLRRGDRVIIDTATPVVIPEASSVPAGGTSGQVLAKASSADFDTHWATASGGGSSYGPPVTVTVTDAGATNPAGFYGAGRAAVVGEWTPVDRGILAVQAPENLSDYDHMTLYIFEGTVAGTDYPAINDAGTFSGGPDWTVTHDAPTITGTAKTFADLTYTLVVVDDRPAPAASATFDISPVYAGMALLGGVDNPPLPPEGTYNTAVVDGTTILKPLAFIGGVEPNTIIDVADTSTGQGTYKVMAYDHAVGGPHGDVVFAAGKDNQPWPSAVFMSDGSILMGDGSHDPLAGAALSIVNQGNSLNLSGGVRGADNVSQLALDSSYAALRLWGGTDEGAGGIYLACFAVGSGGYCKVGVSRQPGQTEATFATYDSDGTTELWSIEANGDEVFYTDDIGPVLTDRGDGLKKRLVITNGVITVETVP